MNEKLYLDTLKKYQKGNNESHLVPEGYNIL